MKRNLLIVCLFACTCAIRSAGYAQDIDIDSIAKDHFRTIVGLMLSGNARELSKYVVYPLRRNNPLPDIANEKQFIAQFPILIDSAFREQLKKYSDSDVVKDNYNFGLVGDGFGGDIWITDDTEIKIVTLNYSSEAEQALRKEMIRNQKERMYPSVRNWDQNILVARSKKLLIRVDYVGKKIRYVAWSIDKSQADKPDLVIMNGVQEFQGSQGGTTWTFNNSGFSYVVDDSQIGKSEEDVGYFLIVSKGDKVLSTSRLELIK